jgi:choline dehydrogenase-like flavoprotein
MPKPQLDWRLTSVDGHSVTVLAKAVAAEIRRVGLGSVELHPMLAHSSGDWIFAGNLAGHDSASEAPEMSISWHHMGTTRMSSSPHRGVVDPDCRVHGIDNLFVAGSSVFPTASSGSPTLTIVALALRLAQHLERRPS